MQRKADQIVISRLEIFPCIGATEEERGQPQKMLVSLVLEPRTGFAAARDKLELTVDYDAVAQAVKKFAASGKRVLIETLAEDIASLLIRDFPLAAIEVELRKFALPDTEFAGVRIWRKS